MRRVLQLIVFSKSLATGLMAPVLSLALLAHGATVSTVSLLIGVYSFTVIAAEFPSGVFADLYGRKHAFLLSTILSFLGYAMMLFSNSLFALFPSIIFNGLGRAFSSGSIDALAIDSAGTGKDALIHTTARLSVLESSGMAIGALVGGVLSGLGTRYAANLGANLAIFALLFFLTIAFVNETKCTSKHRRVGTQVRDSVTFLLQKGSVRALVVFSLITGFALISLETYWQLALSTFSPAPWVFGAVSFGGFLSVIIGSVLAKQVLFRYRAGSAAVLLGCKALLGIIFMLLVFQSRQIPFIVTFMFAYVFVGGGGVVESTLLNQVAPTEQRASILSLFSLITQIGVLLASLLGFAVSTQTDFRNMWTIGGVVLLIGALISWWVLLKAGKLHGLGESA